jgi:hypothetical protein
MFINDPKIRILPIKIILFSPNLKRTINLGKNPNSGGKPLILPREIKIHQFKK